MRIGLFFQRSFVLTFEHLDWLRCHFAITQYCTLVLLIAQRNALCHVKFESE
jgi:hypothetical protein